MLFPNGMSEQQEDEKMKKTIARISGDVAGFPCQVARVGCLGVGYTGTGIRKVGEAIETAGFVSAAKMAEYRDSAGNTVEDFILGLGEKKTEVVEA